MTIYLKLNFMLYLGMNIYSEAIAILMHLASCTAIKSSVFIYFWVLLSRFPNI